MSEEGELLRQRFTKMKMGMEDSAVGAASEGGLPAGLLEAHWKLAAQTRHIGEVRARLVEAPERVVSVEARQRHGWACNTRFEWYQPHSPPPPGASIGGFYKCERCGALGHEAAICRAPNACVGGHATVVEHTARCNACGFHGHMARQCHIVPPSCMHSNRLLGGGGDVGVPRVMRRFEEQYGGAGRQPQRQPQYCSAEQQPQRQQQYGGTEQQPQRQQQYGGIEQQPQRQQQYGGAGQRPQRQQQYGGAGQQPLQQQQ